MSAADLIKETKTALEKFLKNLPDPKNDEMKLFDPSAIILLRTFPRYQERLATFDVTKWSGKPACLSAPFCAIYGWSCKEKDVLKCPDCGEVLLGELPARNKDFFPKKVDNLLTMLTSGHASWCEFAISHEPFEFLKKNDSPYLFKKRLQSFPKTIDFLPKVESTLSEDDKQFLGENFWIFVKNKTYKNEIIELAANGWSFTIENKIELLLCEDDVRQIPLERLKKTASFNAVSEHRTWSIWQRSYDMPDQNMVYQGLVAIGKMGLSDDLYGAEKLLSVLREEVAAKESQEAPSKRARMEIKNYEDDQSFGSAARTAAEIKRILDSAISPTARR